MNPEKKQLEQFVSFLEKNISDLDDVVKSVDSKTIHKQNSTQRRIFCNVLQLLRIRRQSLAYAKRIMERI